MSFIKNYADTLRTAPKHKTNLHIIGRELVAISIGVFFYAWLRTYAGLLFIGGILLMLPLLSEVLKARGKKSGKKRKR